MKIEGLEKLLKDLKDMENIDFGNASKKAAVDIYNMGQTRTPKDTGELRTSMAVNKNSGSEYEVGYAKEYAPHVEYGHRIVRNGTQVGYVDGQYFLKAMVEDEEDKFKDYVKLEIEKAGY